MKGTTLDNILSFAILIALIVVIVQQCSPKHSTIDPDEYQTIVEKLQTNFDSTQTDIISTIQTNIQSLDSVMADQAPGLVAGPWQQGLAFGVKSDSPGAGRFFWSGYFNTQYYADPSTQEIVVLMKQTYGLVTDTTSTAFNALLWN